LPELGEVVDKLAVAFTTAQRAIEGLELARIVKRVGRRCKWKADADPIHGIG